MKIIFFKHNQINKQKWDSVIGNADNGSFYALSWYLDIVSPNWEALICGDYEILMPLPNKKKYGFKYLIQPPFCQQLGIYSKNNTTTELQQEYIKKIKSKFKYAILNLDFNPSCKPVIRKNYELDLSLNYAKLFNAYSTNNKRNLKKVNGQKLEIIQDILPQDLWRFKKQNPVNKLSNWHYEKLLEVLEIANEKEVSKNYGIIDANNNLIAVVCLIEYGDKLTFLVSSSNKFGKENFAMFYLVDWVIQKYAGTNKVFDFEGGSIPNLARFFSGFGAKPKEYFQLKLNNLIWPINKLIS